ncbi:esterase, putative [Bodo saltans]|uniref:Esterase, putative n=1 Tax=Bodo saltans TaxID=75058 RepID=A0A0S4J0U3_BODSA|nr:esterase, putative [Bodo saltans]|eukprot:CUG43119.1 esterase, putative [Bodo saltans]
MPPRKNILIVGDSLTEFGYDNRWVSNLQHEYQRRADVVARGFSGYNTRWVLEMLNDDARSEIVVPVTQSLFCAVFLGANDAAAGFATEVPLEEYQSNLRGIIRALREKAHPEFGVVVVTPPPVDQEVLLAYTIANWNPAATCSPRTLEHTKLYRDAALQVAQEEGCVAVDLYKVFLGDDVAQSFAPNQPWSKYFPDGLHFNDEGGKLISTALLAALPDDCKAASLPMDAPDWLELASRTS